MQIEKTTQHRGEDETKRSGNLDRKYRGEPDGYRRCTCDLFVPGGYLYGIRAFDKTGRYPGCMCEGLHTESKAKRIPKSASDCGDSDFLVK